MWFIGDNNLNSVDFVVFRKYIVAKQKSINIFII